MRDWESLVNLFVDDIGVTGNQRGRQALTRWYESAISDPPLHGSRKVRWPGRDWVEESFHEAFPTWREFWDAEGYGEVPVEPPADLERFIAHLRRGAPTPRVEPGGGSSAAER